MRWAYPASRRVPSQGSQAGFTLVELMVTILVAGILAAAVLAVFTSVLRTFSTSQIRMQNQDQARLAMNQLTRYLRMSSVSESITTTRSDAIQVAGPQEIVFYTDLDGDGAAEKTRYYLSGTTLFMQTAEPVMTDAPPTYAPYSSTGEIIRTGVRNGVTPIFRYYRLDSATGELVLMTSTNTFDLREQILSVECTLYVNDSPELTDSAVRLASRVQIRQRYNGGLSQ